MQTLGLPAHGEALDVGCGAGAPIHHIGPLFPGLRWTGVDYAGSLLFPMGRPLLEKRGIEVDFIESDFLKLTELLPDRKFDVVLSIKRFRVCRTTGLPWISSSP